MTQLIPYIIAWVVLAVAVGLLALFRKTIAAREDDMLHLSGGNTIVEEQVSVAKKLEAIDRWGKILTIILILTGLVLAGFYGVYLWEESSKAGLS